MEGDTQAGKCQTFIEELNRVGRLWDKDGVRLYPLIDRAVAAIAVCRDATDPQDAQAILGACSYLTGWIEAHRSHLAAMTDVVQTMITTAHICVDHGHWADACDKGEC